MDWRLFSVFSVAALSGLYTSAWGAFKDGPFEGFRARRFPRSLFFSLGLVGLTAAVPSLRTQFFALSYFQLFFFAMGLERTWSEIYKWSFRPPRDVGRFAIPQQLTLFGRSVSATGRARAGVGFALALAFGVTLTLPIASLTMWLATSFATGLGVSMGGAYKDAPFEGFQPLKFFRSSVVLTLVAPLLWRLGALPLGMAVFVLVGIERFLVEYYKSFVLASVPGKFRTDLVPDSRFLRIRSRYHLCAAAIAVVAVGLYGFSR